MENVEPPAIFVVDDDPSICRGLTRLFGSAGMRVHTFDSADAFLAQNLGDRPGCIVLDACMPGLSGLDLQAALASRNIRTPIIFLTGQGDVPMSVQAMKSGAADFLIKPVDRTALMAAVHQALQKDRAARAARAEAETIQQRLRTLTPREQEVLAFVVEGLLNKQIAAELGIGEKTVKFHRAHIMQKMQVTSVAELVRATEKAGNKPAPGPGPSAAD